MSGEDTLMQVRKDKHQELNGGTYPLATDFNCTIEYLLDRNWNPETETSLDPNVLGTTAGLHGRITNLRKSGGITFIKLADHTGSMQLILSKGNLTDYDRLPLLDLGDIIEVRGPCCMSKTGEKSLLVTSWKVLTKSHRAPPEKFVGIADPELKARKRYLDLMSSEEARARFTVRSYIIRGIRDYMERQSFLEVETSTLNTLASGANAKPFTTHHNALDVEMRLRIAPELYLKRLLVGGLDRVFEIGRVYRNEGIDTKHNPEFTMMESYQAYGRFPELISMTKDILIGVYQYCEAHLPANILPFFHKWAQESPFLIAKDDFVTVTMAEAVYRALDKAGLHIEWNGHNELHELSYSSPYNERLSKIDRTAMWEDVDASDAYGSVIAALFEHVAEPFLTEDYRTTDGTKSLPVFITEYPKEISPLARPSDTNPEVCDRFELFIEGRELANAFQELNDPDEQARRFKEQLETNAKDAADYDADYIEALEFGMPPAIGFGMGIDRLVMLMTNTTSIKDVILFPTLRPEK
jgi:lysyl-tRNA synthetase, class II